MNDLLLWGCSPNLRGEHYATPLHSAALRGFEELTSAGLLREANVDAPDRVGAAPLIIWAVDEGRLGTAELLLASGADVGICRFRGTSAVDAAARKGRVDILQTV